MLPLIYSSGLRDLSVFTISWPIDDRFTYFKKPMSEITVMLHLAESHPLFRRYR